MFLFNSDTSLMRSIFLRTDNDPLIYLFSGSVPDTIGDVPFNIQNLEEVSRNAEAMLRYQSNVVDSDTEKKSLLEGDHGICHMPIKRSVMDVQRGMYRLAPRYQGRYLNSLEYSNEFPTNRDDWFEPLNGEPDQDDLFGLNYQVYYGDYGWRNERVEGNTYAANYSMLASNRFPFANDNGILMEFEQPVEVTHLEVWQAFDHRYTAPVFNIETFNAGTGLWEVAATVDVPDNDQNNIAPLSVPITADKFIVSAVDTGSLNWYYRHISLLSTTAPYNVETVDLTWGLMYPWDGGLNAFGVDRGMTASFNDIGRWPVLMMSVGEVRDADAALILNRSRGLPGFFNPKMLNFTLNLGASTGE